MISANKWIKSYPTSLVLISLISTSFLITGCEPPNTKHPHDYDINKPYNPPVNDNKIDPEVIDKIENIETKNQQEISTNFGLPHGFMLMGIHDIYVVDGDTIHGTDDIGKKIKVRLTGIDAPESNQTLGKESTEALKDCIGNGNNVTLMTRQNDYHDKYGRILARVNSESSNCNLKQVESGMAWFYDKYAHELPSADAKMLSQAQDYAKSQNMGIWSQPLTPAWEYRQQSK